MNTSNSRVTARVPENIKSTIEKAALIQGTNVNQFMVQASLQLAHDIIEQEQRLIDQERSIRLSSKDVSHFLDLLDNPPEPSKKLIRASKRHHELVNKSFASVYGWITQPIEIINIF